MHQGQLLRLIVAGHEQLTAGLADTKSVGHTGGEEQPLLRVKSQLDAARPGSGVRDTEHGEAGAELEQVQPPWQIDSVQG
jgi:hypothetical protein